MDERTIFDQLGLSSMIHMDPSQRKMRQKGFSEEAEFHPRSSPSLNAIITLDELKSKMFKLQKRPVALSVGSDESSQSSANKKRKTESDEGDEEAKKEFYRKRNAMYSRRKYTRKKIELEVLQQQKAKLKSENRNFRDEGERLTSLIGAAKKVIEDHKKGGSLYGGNALVDPVTAKPANTRTECSSTRANFPLLQMTQPPQEANPLMQFHPHRDTSRLADQMLFQQQVNDSSIPGLAARKHNLSLLRESVLLGQTTFGHQSDAPRLHCMQQAHHDPLSRATLGLQQRQPLSDLIRSLREGRPTFSLDLGASHSRYPQSSNITQRALLHASEGALAATLLRQQDAQQNMASDTNLSSLLAGPLFASRSNHQPSTDTTSIIGLLEMIQQNETNHHG
jgi:hypothetical protein